MPAAYQRVADAIIYELKMEENLGAYFDDMLSSDPTLEACLKRAVIIVNKLTKYGIIVNQQKSYFGMKAIPALGWIVDGNGKHLHPAKVEKIRNIQFPTTSTHMKAFLGLCNFIRDSLKHWSIITAILDEVSLLKVIPDTPQTILFTLICPNLSTLQTWTNSPTFSIYLKSCNDILHEDLYY